MRAPELFDLSGKIAIVSGGGTGLGYQMAEALGEFGARLVLCARNGERCVAAAAALADGGIEATGMACDVRNRSEIEKVVHQARSEYGGIDILVNNAGTSWKDDPEAVPLEGWDKVMDVNLRGTFLFCQAAGRDMIDRGAGGSVINISSFTAFRGLDPAELNSTPYAASKGGITSLTIDLAVKWARHGIRVNALAPGWFRSDLTKSVLEDSEQRFERKLPLGRLGGPDDLKGAVVFLASHASDYVTGQTLAVDGGALAVW
jgi:NAD(P)-dependent dehydrogenase (short-subunit alcohol dehydrogenase family)